MNTTTTTQAQEWATFAEAVKLAAVTIREARGKLTDPVNQHKAGEFARDITIAINDAWDKTREPVGILIRRAPGTATR